MPGTSPMALFDASGRRLGGLAPGENDVGGLRAGAYFVVGRSEATKVVVTGD